MSFSDVSNVENFFVTPNEGFATTTSGAVSSGATIVGLSSVADLTNGSTFVGVIEPGEAKEQVFTGTVDTGGSQITGVKWLKGTNVAHSAGVAVVDYDTGAGIKMMSEGIRREHKDTGAHDPTLISNRTSDTAPAGGDFLLTSDISASGALKKVTRDNLFRGNGLLGAVRIYTASDTWTKPDNLNFIEVEVLGGGGGGGAGGLSAAAIGVGAGGGAGGWAYAKVDAATLSATETVTVGAGGAGGSSGQGSDGGASSFGAYAVAGGGKGGYWRSNTGFSAQTGTSAGGLATAGDIQVQGQHGEPAIALNANSMKSGAGGSSRYGAGGLWLTTNAGGDANGNSATGYGAGGSGGYNDDNDSDSTGGNGSPGIVIVREYYK